MPAFVQESRASLGLLGWPLGPWEGDGLAKGHPDAERWKQGWYRSPDSVPQPTSPSLHGPGSTPKATCSQPTPSSMDSSFKYLQATWISPWRESTESGAWEDCSKARRIWVQIQVPSHLGSGTLGRSLTSLSTRMWCLQEETKNSTCLRGSSQGRTLPSSQEHLRVNHEGDEETEASKMGLGVRPASRCHLLGMCSQAGHFTSQPRLYHRWNGPPPFRGSAPFLSWMPGRLIAHVKGPAKSLLSGGFLLALRYWKASSA